MVKHRSRNLLLTLSLIVLAVFANQTTPLARAAAMDTTANHVQSGAALSSNVSVFATGFDNPRGLKFGPDGNLYVAEGGSGGTNSTVGKCDQVPPPIGPYTGSKTGSHISKVTPDGKRTIIADNLPSSQTSQASGGFISGVADVAFFGNTLYAILAGAACSHGVPDVPNALIKVNTDGTSTQITDLGAFLKANPVKHPEPADFEPDGSWYSLLTVGSDLYALEPNHGELDKLTTDGKISRVVDISDSQGHIVPTAMALGPDGSFYVGNLGTFPAASHSKILKITPSGQISVYARGLTTVLGVAFDSKGQLYALEMSAPVTTQGPPVAPNTGRVVRVASNGTLTPVATGLMFPTAMTFGSDGKLYISNCGFGCPTGQGQIVRADLSAPLPTTVPTTGESYAVTDLWLISVVGGLLIVIGFSMRRRSV